MVVVVVTALVREAAVVGEVDRVVCFSSLVVVVVVAGIGECFERQYPPHHCLEGNLLR